MRFEARNHLPPTSILQPQTSPQVAEKSRSEVLVGRGGYLVEDGREDRDRQEEQGVSVLLLRPEAALLLDLSLRLPDL